MRISVKYRVIYRHREKYAICEMCRFFSVSRSGYYDWVKRMEIPAKDLPLAEKIRVSGFITIQKPFCASCRSTIYFLKSGGSGIGITESSFTVIRIC